MNAGQFNHRIKFSKEVTTLDQYGGGAPELIPEYVSDTYPNDTTWGALEPIKQWNQMALQLGETDFNQTRILTLRYRNNWQPEKDMVFEDLNHAGDIYTIHSILPYYPGSKSTFQNSQKTVYKDNVYIFIVGIKRV